MTLKDLNRNKTVAIVHDWFISVGGAENVIKSIYELYPSADIYALLGNENVINKLNLNGKVYCSFLQSFPKSYKYHKYLLPLFRYAVEDLDLSRYKLVISSSHSFAKGVITHPEQIHICYCHTPIRYGWDLYYDYLKYIKNPVFKVLFKAVIHKIRIWDVVSSNRVDYFIANSKFVAKRILKIYRRKAKVIYPPVNVEKFTLEGNKEDFYLVVSRLVKHKMVDLIVKAFSKMPKKKLIIIGDGEEFSNIKKIKPDNVEMLGYKPLEEVIKYMQKAKAFINCAVEDFGIANVEAQACGTPVIAFGKGGALETVIDGKTGVLFGEQSISSIMEAVKRFENTKFDYHLIRKNAETFSEERFKSEFKSFVEEKLNDKKII